MKTFRHLSVLVPLAFFLIFPIQPCRAAPGDLDPLDINLVQGGFTGRVPHATAVQPDGKVLIGGNFTSVLGVPRGNIARLNADGTLDAAFDPILNEKVWSIAVQPDGKILISGDFTGIQPHGALSSVPRNRIARVNSDGTLDSGFDPNGSGTVGAMVLQPDGKILLAGLFDSLQPNGAEMPTTRYSLARVNADGNLDTGFDPSPNGAVCIALQPDGKILIGGTFTSLAPNGGPTVLRNRIARLNPDGTVDSGFNPSPNGTFVRTIAVDSDGKILFGGNFTTVKPDGVLTTTRKRIARVNAGGTLDTSFDPSVGSVVAHYVGNISLQADGKVLVAGFFSALQPNGAPSQTARNCIARLNKDGTLDMGFDPNPNGPVEDIALQVDGRVLVRGGFTSLQPNGGIASVRNTFARLQNDASIHVMSVPDATQVLWTRGGGGPELSCVTFEVSIDAGASWTPLGMGNRIGSTGNWEIHSLALPGTGFVRARGVTVSGMSNGSSGMIEQAIAFNLDTTTLAPTLTAPAASAFINNTVNVAFTLPEAALPGSVTLTFAGALLTRPLVLTASQESAGTHSFSFDAGSPAAAAEVESGLPLEYDGPYTVTLSYRDAQGNPAATAVATDVTLDTQPPVVGGNFSPLLIPAGALPDYRVQATGDAVSFTQLPAPGTAFSMGTVAVFLIGTDAAGNWGHTYFYVRVVPANPVRTVLGSKGAPVPGAGVENSGIPAGAVWATFGVPSINDAGQAVVLATYKVGAVSTTAILGWELADMATMKVVVKVGQVFQGDSRQVISALKDPVLGVSGAVVWIGTLSVAAVFDVPAKTYQVVFSVPDLRLVTPGYGPGIIARTGFGHSSTGVLSESRAEEFGSFTSVAAGRRGVAFTARLSSKTAGVSPGPGGVTTANDSGLFVWDSWREAVTLALREGDPLLGSTVKTVAALVAHPGSAGQGRGMESDGADDYMNPTNSTVVRVTLADARQALGLIGQDGSGAFHYVSGGDAVGYGPGAVWQKFGLPTQKSGSTAMAFLGTVKPGTGTATSANNVAIFAEDDVDYLAARIVGKGDAAPGCAGTFAAFKDPVNASNRSVAFIGAMKTVPGATTAANNDGIWFSDDTNGMRLVARESAQPPEAPAGAQWKAFTSLALPEGRGPIFVATMHSKSGAASPGPGGITTANDVGLWATDSFGALRLLIRKGDAIGASTVRSFTVLGGVIGSPAQTRSFNSLGSVIVKATDTTGAQHLLHIAVP